MRLHYGYEKRVAMIIKSKNVIKGNRREGSIFMVLEDFSHAVELAYAIELGDAAQVYEAVEADAEVNQSRVVGLKRAVLKQKIGLYVIRDTLTRFS